MLRAVLCVILGFLCIFYCDARSAMVMKEYPQFKLCDGEESFDIGGYKNPTRVLRNMYENCTHIVHHLVIQHLERDDDTSFLDSIVEVYGIVKIQSNFQTIKLKNLIVIRGNTLDRGNSLIFSPYKSLAAPVYLPALKSVMRGNVEGRGSEICYMHNIDWDTIFKDPSSQKLILKTKPGENCRSSSYPCQCQHQNETCWGSSPDLCQKPSPCEVAEGQLSCKDRSSDLEVRCSPQCVGGCYGPLPTQCLACKMFLNGTKCTSSCGAKHILDTVEDRTILNKNFRYEFKLFCLKKCPDHYFMDGGRCVRSCRKGTQLIDFECKTCPDSTCSPNNCDVKDIQKKITSKTQRARMGYVSADNKMTLTSYTLKLLANCTRLTGGISLNVMSSLNGYTWVGFEDGVVKYEDLNHLSNLEEIYGEVSIDLQHYPKVESLYFLSKLRRIVSKETFSIGNAPGLKYLGLKSLKDIQVKKLSICKSAVLCPKLCYMEDFREFINETQNKVEEISSPTKTEIENCKKQGKECDGECKPGLGCWGPGPSMCRKCNKYQIKQICVNNCTAIPGYHLLKNRCVPCHAECERTCFGSGPDQCIGDCKNFKIGNRCVEKCESYQYADALNICKNCSSNCTIPKMGNKCSGPRNYPEDGGCNSCQFVVVPNLETDKSLANCWSRKPEDGYYPIQKSEIIKRFGTEAAEFSIFAPCHSNCLACYGPQKTNCHRCRSSFHKYKDSCLENCTIGTFPKNNSYGEILECADCNSECSERFGCRGPSVYDCFRCQEKKIYITTKSQKKWYCAAKCPKEKPYTIFNQETNENVCSDTDVDAYEIPIIVGSISATLFVIFVSITLIMRYWKRQSRAKFARESLRARYTRKVDDDDVALQTTDCKPDISLLKVIGCNQILKKQLVGTGAFGTVYEGIWTPLTENEHSVKIQIQIAIKELNEHGSKKNTEEFLSEARLMASVDHEHCMKLLGVCLTTELMLISEFMPKGNLKNYLVNNKDKIGSQCMLRWALQIAKGMSYLNNRGIVHRDLAARNVLLDTDNHIRITDFGLAKLVGSQNPFQDRSQKLPIRWLALECIEHQIFSTKSDVWAYGVTLWEIFTYGDTPYTNIRSALDVLPHLNQGDRLPQPMVCTLDMYMLLIKCWLADSESRPTFDELITELKKMAADPGRYLIIENDELWKGTLRSNSNFTITSSLNESPQILQVDFSPFGATSEIAIVDLDTSAKMKAMDLRRHEDEVDHYVSDPTLYSVQQFYMGENSRPRPMKSRLTSLDETEEREDFGYEIPNEKKQQFFHRNEYENTPSCDDTTRLMMDQAASYVNTGVLTDRPLSVNNPEYVTY